MPRLGIRLVDGLVGLLIGAVAQGWRTSDVVGERLTRVEERVEALRGDVQSLKVRQSTGEIEIVPGGNLSRAWLDDSSWIADSGKH